MPPIITIASPRGEIGKRQVGKRCGGKAGFGSSAVSGSISGEPARKQIAPGSVNATARVTITVSGGPGKKKENNAENRNPRIPVK
jgi:hypothetical protein